MGNEHNHWNTGMSDWEKIAWAESLLETTTIYLSTVDELPRDHRIWVLYRELHKELKEFRKNHDMPPIKDIKY